MQTVAEHGTCLHLVCFLSGVQHIHHHGCDASLLYTMIWLAGAVGSPVEVPCGLRLKVRVCCAVLCWGLGQLQQLQQCFAASFECAVLCFAGAWDSCSMCQLKHGRSQAPS